MGIFNYNKQQNSSTDFISESILLTNYSYHGLDNGLMSGYYHYGVGLGAPLTILESLIGSHHSQGIIPNLPWNPDSNKQISLEITQHGWKTIDAQSLNYQGSTDKYGTYYGETCGYQTAQAEVLGKYNEAGELTSMAFVIRGTSGPRETLIVDTILDAFNDIATTLGPIYNINYINKAYGQLLTQVADFAKQNGLGGEDILFTGHSLGGLAVNSAAMLSDTHWDGFFSDSQYIAYASPTYESEKVVNIGFENDPVFRVVDHLWVTPSTFFTHDKNIASATNNIVNFNDYYALYAKLLPFSLLNLPSWLSHMPTMYSDVVKRIIDSKFYDLTWKDSTVIVSTLSDALRGKTWVKDHNYSAEEHEGSTFILGSDKNDLLYGGKGNDYLEGGKGNDTFKDEGGYNLILGGEGDDTLDLQNLLNKYDITKDEDNLYLLDEKGQLTIANSMETIIADTPLFAWFTKTETFHVTDKGLIGDHTNYEYNSSISGDELSNLLYDEKDNQWIFAREGDDTIYSTHHGAKLVGGEGNDTFYCDSDNTTLIFTGNFGQDIVHGLNSSDHLIFMGTGDSTQYPDYQDHLSIEGNNLVLNFGNNSVTFIDITLSELESAHITIC